MIEDEGWIRIATRSHYYKGDLSLRLEPDEKWRFELRWEAYQGGEVILHLDRDELKELIEAASKLLDQQEEEVPWVTN